jgi:hypothetical protein
VPAAAAGADASVLAGVPDTVVPVPDTVVPDTDVAM